MLKQKKIEKKLIKKKHSKEIIKKAEQEKTRIKQNEILHTVPKYVFYNGCR